LKISSKYPAIIFDSNQLLDGQNEVGTGHFKSHRWHSNRPASAENSAKDDFT
jgi:hypothetical protein